MNTSTNAAAAAARIRRLKKETLPDVYAASYEKAYELWLNDRGTLAAAWLALHEPYEDCEPPEILEPDPCDFNAPEKDYHVPENDPAPKYPAQGGGQTP
jgi:hypothetical protein